jgi:hypothetical protein
MLSKRIGAASLVVAALACPACQTVTRAGEDAMVVGTFPIHALTTPYQETASALEDDHASPWVSPIIFAGHFAEDVGVTVISAGDLGISPVIGVVEVASPNEDLTPLRVYRFESFPPEFQKTRARRVEEDVAKGAVVVAAAVVVLGVYAAAEYYGQCGSCNSGDGVTGHSATSRKQPKPAP